MRFLQSLLHLLTAPVRAARDLPGAVLVALARGRGAVGRALEAVGAGLSSAGRGAVALLPGEWKKPIAALFVTGLALVPLIYSGNMTWSFLDPSNNLDQVTAAVVNEDESAAATSPDGEKTDLDVGAEFTDTLLDLDKESAYHFVEVSPPRHSAASPTAPTARRSRSRRTSPRTSPPSAGTPRRRPPPCSP